MDNVDKFFRKSHYNILRILLSICGLWPFDSIIKRCTIYLGALLILGSGLTFQVMGMIEVWPDSFEVLDCLPLIMYALFPVAKSICMMYNISKIKILLAKMKEHWYSQKSDEETKILQSYAIYGKKFGYAYTGIMLGHSGLYLFSALLTKFFHIQSKKDSETLNKVQGAQVGLPYRVNYMIDLDTYYIPIFLHTATCEVSYLLLMVSQDVLYLTFVQHCCGRFAALRYILEDMSKFKNNSSDRVITRDNRCYAYVAYGIRRHTEVIQFIDVLESLFQLPLFLHISGMISIISIVGYQVITNTQDMSRLSQHAIYFSAAVLNTFIQNWPGQRIIDYSEKVHNYAYNVQWYDMPNATKKLLIIIMLRSIKPSQITASKFVVMSYVSFNTAMRLSLSYLMLLRSMQ